MIIPAKPPAEPPLLLDINEFNRALSGDDWLSRLVQEPLLWAMALAFIGTVILLVVLVIRHRNDVAAHRPTWRLLAGALQLTKQQRQLLDGLARAVGLKNPAPLVISRGFFDRAVRRQHPIVEPAPVQSLRKHIFNDSARPES